MEQLAHAVNNAVRYVDDVAVKKNTKSMRETMRETMRAYHGDCGDNPRRKSRLSHARLCPVSRKRAGDHTGAQRETMRRERESSAMTRVETRCPKEHVDLHR